MPIDTLETQPLTWPTATRFKAIWNGRREIRNWWLVFPIATLIHAQMMVGRRWPKSLGRMPVRATLRSGHRISCLANEAFQVVEVFISGDYKYPEISYSQARTILDVGANIGVSTIWFSEQCPFARVFAIEPNAETSVRLLRNINRNALANRVTVLTVALGKGCRQLHLVLGDHSGVAHTDVEPHEGSQVVWSADLGTVLEIVGGHVDVMKLDCEGAEYEIILEADDHTLSKIDNIVGEYHGSRPHDRSRLFSRLQEAGFKVSHEGPSQRSMQIGTFSAVRPPRV